MILSSLLLSIAAAAGPQTLTWDLELNGKTVGQRSLTVATEQTVAGELRTLRAETRVDAKALGLSFAFRQNLTANVDRGPASFVSLIERDGETTEIQGRLAGTGWRLSVTGQGRSRSYEIPAADVDLSTADLLDPWSTVGLHRAGDRVGVLSTETGQVLAATVERLGPSTLTVQGRAVPVEGYRLDSSEGGGTFFYTTDGWLVRFESRVFGQNIVGQLTRPPPASADDEPVDVFGPEIRAVDL